MKSEIDKLIAQADALNSAITSAAKANDLGKYGVRTCKRLGSALAHLQACTDALADAKSTADRGE